MSTSLMKNLLQLMKQSISKAILLHGASIQPQVGYQQLAAEPKGPNAPKSGTTKAPELKAKSMTQQKPSFS